MGSAWLATATTRPADKGNLTKEVASRVRRAKALRRVSDMQQLAEDQVDRENGRDNHKQEHAQEHA